MAAELGGRGGIAPPIIHGGHGGAWRGMDGWAWMDGHGWMGMDGWAWMDGHGWGMAPEIQQILAIDYRKHPCF